MRATQKMKERRRWTIYIPSARRPQLKTLGAETVVQRCKALLRKVERAFRCRKTIDLERIVVTQPVAYHEGPFIEFSQIF